MALLLYTDKRGNLHESSERILILSMNVTLSHYLLLVILTFAKISGSEKYGFLPDFAHHGNKSMKFHIYNGYINSWLFNMCNGYFICKKVTVCLMLCYTRKGSYIAAYITGHRKAYRVRWFVSMTKSNAIENNVLFFCRDRPCFVGSMTHVT